VIPRLALAICLLAAGGAQAQRRARSLGASERKELGFVDLITHHAERALGGASHLMQMDGADDIQPAVYVTLTESRLLTWDEEVMALTGGTPARREVASCGRPCLPKLRDAVARGLAAELDRLRRAGEPRPPRVLVIADDRVPYRTFLLTLGSVAAASAPSPPELALLVRVRGTPRLGEIPFFLTPAHEVRLAENANPLLLHITIEPGRYTARARKGWLPIPESEGTIPEIVRLCGELKARDPGKTVVFLSAPDAMPLERVLALVAPLHLLYPHPTFGGAPRIVGPAE
jgi:hypothetical protein